MRQVIQLVLVIYAKENHAQNGFVLDSIDMTDAVLEQCEYCEEQSDQVDEDAALQEQIEAGSSEIANALQEYMTQNHVNILLEQGKF